MFGNLNKPAFGATTPNTSFGFGATSTTNANPFGQNQLFGKPATGGFGAPSTSTFGQPANTSLFPTTQQQSTNLFQNANNTFGAQPPAQSGFGSNLFGQQQPSTSGLFNNSSTFGQQAKPTGFGFGTAQTQPTLFGQQAQQAPTSNLFQPSTGNLFGGASTFGGGQQAGTVLKFNPVTGTDTMMKNGVAQSINTKHYSITCMKEYESKSFEELRYEDYQANRKGPQQQAGFGTSFGPAASSAPSLFGQQDASKAAFGQTTGFGQTTSTFGQTSAGFGMPNQQSTAGGLFGKPTGFGAATNTTSSFGFNTAQNANPFGANQPAKPFGAAAQPLFGANAAQPGQPGFGTGLFGQSNNQNTATSLFGKPTQSTPSFNQAQNTGFSFNPPVSTQTTSLFQNNKPNLFGQTNTSAAGFGQTNTFGQPGQTAFGSNFGKPAAPAFGQTAQTGFGTSLGLQTQGTSLFGNTAAKPGGLFGNTGSTGLFGNTNTTFQPNTGFGLQTQQQQQSAFPPPDPSEYKNLALITNDPFGDAPHLAGLEPKIRSDPSPAIATNPIELKSLLDSSKKVDMSPNSRLKVFPVKSFRESLFDGIHKPEIGGTTQYAKTNCRRLVIKSRTPDKTNSFRNEILNVLKSPDEGNKSNNNSKEGLNLENSGGAEKRTPLRLTFDSTLNANSDDNRNSPNQSNNFIGNTSVNVATDTNSGSKDNSPIPSDDEENVDPLSSGDSTKKNSCGIICSRPEYYTLPSLEELSQYVDENGACIVKGFTIGRKGYGNVYFPEEIDISGLNIDELVHFRYREINVYPDEATKPPIGQGLNRKAQVTLDNIFPRKNGTNALIKDVNDLLQMNFSEKLRKITVKKDARFVDYRPETGSWVFKVEHFSKYGFNDSDDESEQNGEKKKDKDPKKAEDVVHVNEGLAKVEALKQKRDVKATATDVSKDAIKFGLDKDIFVEEEDQSGSEEDVLAQSMYVDMVEDDYSHIPTHISSDMPMQMPYDSFKTSKTIQVMKSTLFGDDDRSSDGSSSHVSIVRQYLDLPEDLPKVMPVIREEIVVRKRPIVRPKVDKILNYGGSEIPPGLIPNRTYLDMGAFKGKSFKVGWLKGFNFIYLNSKTGEIDGELTVNTVQSDFKNCDPLKDCLIDSLKIVLQESTFQVNSDNIPTYKILKTDSYLRKQTNLFEKLVGKYNKGAQYLHSIWTLCTALWGPSENSIANRRYLLSEWLKINTGEEFNGHPTMSSISETINMIFSLLSVFKVFEAANMAMENKFPSLSLIISQLTITNRTKIFLQEQIESWYNSMTANHINDDLKKIYLLLSGIPAKDNVNTFENIDWKRAFGMHLWYVCPNGASIEMAIELYKRAFESLCYAEKPLPPYSEQYAEDSAYDVLYHILLLYKSRIHRLSSVLNPATHTDDPLDYRLSWLLLQLFLSIDVGLVEESEKTKLTTSFSNQLESLGHWEWAIFTLLHLEDNSLKKNLIMGILDRNLSPEVDKQSRDAQNNLINNMNIPSQWIHLVKGQKTLLLGRYFEAFNHFAYAENYVKANEIMIEHLLPGLFINEQYDIIKIVIDAVKPGSRDILRWNYEAGLFSDFLDLQEKVISAKNEDLLRLQTKLQSISDRISCFPLKTDQQKLCIAEIAKRSASVYKELCKKTRSGIIKTSYSNFIDSLDMPPDFKQNEALYLISNI